MAGKHSKQPVFEVDWGRHFNLRLTQICDIRTLRVCTVQLADKPTKKNNENNKNK